MSGFLNWLASNLNDIISIATAIVTAASGVAALTPTPKDDPLAKAAYSVIDILALNVGRAKDR